MKSTATANTVRTPSKVNDQGPMYAKSSAQAASNAPMKINGAPGKIGSMSPSAPIAISTPEAIHKAIVAGSTRASFDAFSAAALI
jgi:hypothetical protein